MTSARHIAFISPRFPDGTSAGGAETLLRNLAERAARSGRTVTFLTTCARNHFTWANDRPAGVREIDGMNVHFFPVDQDRDIGTFLHIQNAISHRQSITPEEEKLWLKNNVNSQALLQHIETHGRTYDRIVAGPYLFGLIYHAALMAPEKTILVPCLHDEPFAYLSSFQRLFHAMRGIMFNTVPEKELACRIYEMGENPNALAPLMSVVGMGIDPFPSDGTAFRDKHGIQAPYIIYSGRRETLKGTPLLLDYLSAFRARTRCNVKLVLTGSGPVTPEPEMMPHVLDVGFVPEQEKHDAMAGAVAFCHPSVNESLSIVLLEAWLAGTPALVHGRSEVLRYQCRHSRGGLWFNNYPEFEEELLLLLQENDLRHQLGHSGREFVRREYSWDIVEKRLLAALDQ